MAAAGLVGQPGGGAAGTRVIGHVVGVGKHPHPEAMEAVGGAGQLDQGLRLLGSWSSAPGRRALPRPPPRAPGRHTPAPGGGEGAGPGPCTHARPDHRYFRRRVRTMWRGGSPGHCGRNPASEPPLRIRRDADRARREVRLLRESRFESTTVAPTAMSSQIPRTDARAVTSAPGPMPAPRGGSISRRDPLTDGASRGRCVDHVIYEVVSTTTRRRSSVRQQRA